MPSALSNVTNSCPSKKLSFGASTEASISYKVVTLPFILALIFVPAFTYFIEKCEDAETVLNQICNKSELEYFEKVNATNVKLSISVCSLPKYCLASLSLFFGVL